MPAMPSNADPNAYRAELSRRAVLKVSLAASGLLAAGGLIEYLNYQSALGAPTAFELDRPDAYSVGSATHLAEAGAWLLRDAGGLYAISTRCSHLGCTVERQADGFRCPCHGSRFSPEGQVQNGPATRPLSYLKLSLAGQGHVVVHTDQPAEPSARLDA
jgi:Rieske Fe-S protein